MRRVCKASSSCRQPQTSAANLNNLAWLYDQKGDTEKALGHARRAYELSPKRPEIADTLGWL